MFKRGAIFKGAPGDSVGALQTPPIPVELRQAVMDYQNQMQRGLFPWSVFGNIQSQVSYLSLAAIASASLSVLTPYIDAAKGLLSDMENYWYQVIANSNLKPYNFKMPKALPEQFTIEANMDVEIPGYLVQRATVGRMLNPEFKLPVSTIMNRLFPEVTNPVRALAEVRKDSAMNSPIAIQADAILAYREQAKAMREVGDVDGANLYEKVANAMEAQLVPGIQQQPQPQQSGGQRPAQQPVQQPGQQQLPNPANEVMPGETQSMNQQLGG